MSKAKDKPAVAGKTGTPTADSKALTLNGKDEAERKTAMAGAFTSSSLNSDAPGICFTPKPNLASIPAHPQQLISDTHTI